MVKNRLHSEPSDLGENEIRKKSRIKLTYRTSLRNKNENLMELNPLQSSIENTFDDSNDVESVLENHAKRIVEKMQNDPDLMADTKESDKLRREILKKMPQSLSVKKCVKNKLTKSINEKSDKHPIGFLKSTKYKISMEYSHMKIYLENVISNFEFWYDSLKVIEGRFGSATSSYFRFLRLLFLMNISVTVITLLFIVVPQITFKSVFDAFESTENFQFTNIFTGEGFLKKSLLFYGYYSNETLNFYGIPYNMPFAYFFTMLFVYIVTIFLLGYSATLSYRKSFIETEIGLKNLFAQKIFCGWDFSIATKEASHLKSIAIHNELKELLEEILSENENIGFYQRIKSHSLKAGANAFILVTLIVIGSTLWMLLELHRQNAIGPIEIAVAANFFNFVLPMIFTKISNYEDYNKPRNAVGVTLIRSFLLSSVIVGTLVVFWLLHSFRQECWETSLGQDIYRLLLFDFLITTIIHAFNILLFYINRNRNKPASYEFDVAGNTLDLIYNQSLFWMGLFFSPLLTIAFTLKIFLTWYLKRFYLMKFCKPSTKAWRASQTHTWFLTLAFLTLLATTCLMVFILLKIPPTNCGPFEGYEFIYRVIMTEGDGKPMKIVEYFGYLMKPGVVSFLIIGICIRVYYVRAKANAQRDMVKILRNLLVWGSKDKKFLIDYIARVTEGKWQYNMKDGRFVDPYTAVPNITR